MIKKIVNIVTNYHISMSDSPNLIIFTFLMIQEIDGANLPPNVRKQIDEHRAHYLKISQLGLYSSLQKIEQMNIFTKSTCDVQCNIVFSFDGTKYDADLKNDITIYIVRTLNEEIPKLKNKFSMAYIHHSLSSFLYFKSVLQLLPREHLSRLDHFYLIQAGLMVKIVQKFSFGSINSFLESKAEYFRNAQEIEVQHKITLGGNVTRSKLKTLTAQNGPSKNHRLTVESDPSILQVVREKFYGKEIDQYEMTSDGLPTIVQALVTRLYSSTQFLQAEGIMRKSCDVEQLQILENKIMENQKNYQQQIKHFDSPYVLCGCLKKIFNNLYTPLFTYEIYEQIISYRSDGHAQNDVYFAKKCVDQMQKLNRFVFLYMITFMKRGIIANHQFNKMNSHNLAVVFGPCFFRPKQYKLESLMYSGKFSLIIKLVLQHQEEIIGEEEFFNFCNLLERQKMEFLKGQ